MNEIIINTEYIKLDQFLKHSSIAETGGHAKILIQDGIVKVNDEVTLKRGKKLKHGDIIEVNSRDKFIIVKK